MHTNLFEDAIKTRIWCRNTENWIVLHGKEPPLTVLLLAWLENLNHLKVNYLSSHSELVLQTVKDIAATPTTKSISRLSQVYLHQAESGSIDDFAPLGAFLGLPSVQKMEMKYLAADDTEITATREEDDGLLSIALSGVHGLSFMECTIGPKMLFERLGQFLICRDFLSSFGHSQHQQALTAAGFVARSEHMQEALFAVWP